MDVNFKSKKLKKVCESMKELQKNFGRQCARKIARRLEVLVSADNLEHVPHTPPERCHQLTQDKDELFAVDVEKQWRIIFIPDHNPIPRKKDGGIDKEKITSIVITDICEDYHR
ncbi:MAG: killer suppression protein HigA [Pseudomonadota bacterium]|nr:killer suppression protein HigA [Pseudomonadota bacterium]QKK04239.1 MAG: killer suppression protein HigA [Pseudomonadota bacterium]